MVAGKLKYGLIYHRRISSSFRRFWITKIVRIGRIESQGLSVLYGILPDRLNYRAIFILQTQERLCQRFRQQYVSLAPDVHYSSGHYYTRAPKILIILYIIY